jgi:hypothetical protein
MLFARVWPLQFLQKRGVVERLTGNQALDMRKMCEWPSERGERTSCQGIRTTLHQPRLSKVTYLIHGVAGSELAVELDCDDVVPMFIGLLAPLRFLASFFKIHPVSFV